MKKKRVPRWPANTRTLDHMLAPHQPFNDEEKTMLLLPIRLSFEALKSGKGTEQDFHDVCAALNTTVVRRESVSRECLRIAEDALEAMLRMWTRHEHLGKWGFDALALREVAEAIDLHEQFVAFSKPIEMINALKTVMTTAKRYEVAA